MVWASARARSAVVCRASRVVGLRLFPAPLGIAVGGSSGANHPIHDYACESCDDAAYEGSDLIVFERVRRRALSCWCI